MKPMLKPGLTRRLANKDAEYHTASNTFLRSRGFAAKAGKVAQVA